ncbi:OmpA family protein [Marinobacter sp.]|uniref:flagellar protein MotY n=1 Tax=Marinobacter sp. TaxID=50741 RepID=UPI00384E372D
MKLLSFQALLAIMVSAAFSPTVAAATYGAGIENSQWYLSESVFDCTLTHQVPGFGRAVFRHRAGESLGFHLESDTRLMRAGQGTLIIEAPAWRPGAVPRPLGAVKVADGKRPVALDPSTTMSVVSGLMEGMAPTVSRQAWYSDEMVRVRLSNINFPGRFESYRNCVGSLLPVNYDQIKRSRVRFAVDKADLSERDYELLNNIATYVQADSSVERIFVDGHTDRDGTRIHNRALSEKRARVVAEYLKQRGVSEEKIIVRSHADQYPASSVKAENRRTTIRLEKEGERPELSPSRRNAV